MNKIQYNNWKLPGSTIKPAVQKRDSKDNAGYITLRGIPVYFRILSWIFSQDKQACFRFSRDILHLFKHNGSSFVVVYLKECFLITQKYVAGAKVTTTVGVPLSLAGGLPRIIPGPLRSKIRKGDPVAIRMVLTSLAVFRIIRCPGILKTETITAPFKGLSETLPDYEISLALNSLFGKVHSLTWLRNPKHLFLMSAGPNSSVSWIGTWLDIKCWSGSESLPNLTNFINLSGWEETSFAKTLNKEIDSMAGKYSVLDNLVLGRLAQKEEAAGKIRLFAITDSITQAVLAPLHDYIFRLLEKLPTDGTMDQGKPLQRLISLRLEGKFGSNLFHSYDLSAATDRLPAKLQAQALKLLFGNEAYGEAWRQLLVGRTWSSFTYAVGQPMGALSSWGMLALTHHLIVRISAQRVGIKEFDHYALLGDDIVIANDSVAQSYHQIMTEVLGVDINLQKSLISATHFEYAKRLVSVEQELTPIGPKNLLILLRSPLGLISVLKDFLSKGSSFSESEWDSKVDSFPFFRRKSMRSLSWIVKGPFGLIPTEQGLSSNIRLNNALTPSSIDLLVYMIDYTIFNENMSKWSRAMDDFNRVVKVFEVNSSVRTYLTYDDSHTTGLKSLMNGIWDDHPRKSVLTDSNLFFLMRETILTNHDLHLADKPVREGIFDGPTLHYTSEDKAACIAEFTRWARTKISDWEIPLPASDPFKDVSLSVSDRGHQRGKKFFQEVRKGYEQRSEIQLLNGY